MPYKIHSNELNHSNDQYSTNVVKHTVSHLMIIMVNALAPPGVEKAKCMMSVKTQTPCTCLIYQIVY